MARKIKIQDKWIGGKSPCFIIAEVGANHNQDMRLTKKLIDAAVDAGADAVKFQSFTVENWISKEATEMPGISSKGDLFKTLKKFELPYVMYKEIVAYCRKKGIICFSTPAHTSDIKELLKIGTPAFKLGSVQITDYPTVVYAARAKKPVIISAGASSLKEVAECIRWIKAAGNKNIVLLQCTTLYPTQAQQVNLRVIETFREDFPDLIVGFSDHTLEPYVFSTAAVAMGARVLERHITLDRAMKGPDHHFALEPREFALMVQKVRGLEKALGSSVKKPLAKERKNSKLCRRSIVACRDIPRGKIITVDDLTTKRPGWGLAPKNISCIIGKKAVKDIGQDKIITKRMFR